MEVDSSDSEHSDQVHVAPQPQLAPEERRFINLMEKCREITTFSNRNLLAEMFPQREGIMDAIFYLARNHEIAEYLGQIFALLPPMNNFILSFEEYITNLEDLCKVSFQSDCTTLGPVEAIERKWFFNSSGLYGNFLIILERLETSRFYSSFMFIDFVI